MPWRVDCRPSSPGSSPCLGMILPDAQYSCVQVLGQLKGCGCVQVRKYSDRASTSQHDLVLANVSINSTFYPPVTSSDWIPKAIEWKSPWILTTSTCLNNICCNIFFPGEPRWHKLVCAFVRCTALKKQYWHPRDLVLAGSLKYIGICLVEDKKCQEIGLAKRRNTENPDFSTWNFWAVTGCWHPWIAEVSSLLVRSTVYREVAGCCLSAKWVILRI